MPCGSLGRSLLHLDPSSTPKSYAKQPYFSGVQYLWFHSCWAIGIGSICLCGPPTHFVPAAVQLAMMDATQGNGELVANLAPERPRLGKAQVVGITRRAPTDETRLGRDELKVPLVASAPRLRGRLPWRLAWARGL